MGLFDFFKKPASKPKPIVTFTVHEYTPDELQQQREQKIDQIKVLSAKAFPSKNGLRPHEISLLSSATWYKTSGNDFPQYWRYDFGIEDPQKILDQLQAGGFIRPATAMESIARLKVAELKEILIEAGVKPVGKKADLISAVKEHISEEVLSSKIPVRKFVLTELGEEELKENEYVTYFGSSRRYGLTVWDMNKMVQNAFAAHYRDLIWGYLNQQEYESAKELQTNGDMYSFYRRTVRIRQNMCNFLMEENRNLHDALRLLVESLYYDFKIDAVFSFRTFLDIQRNAKDEPPPKFSNHLTMIFYVKKFDELKDKLEMPTDSFREEIAAAFSNCPLQYELIRDRNITRISLTNKELADLVLTEMDENIEAAAQIYQKVEIEIRNDKSPLYNRR